MICGIDEAGRGALAGPVYAAAVILPASFDISLLNDSKKLSEKKREHARAAILEQALFWHIAWSSHETIDAVNILQATLAAMKEACAGVVQRFSAAGYALEDLTVLVDGNQLPDIGGRFRITAEPHADARYPAVMAASILAKTARDSRMRSYHLEYPVYRYDVHKGYGTALHRSLIREYGPSPIQRKSFKIKSV
ncbi:MAG: ribonuclease HII [Treponema sp.]